MKHTTLAIFTALLIACPALILAALAISRIFPLRRACVSARHRHLIAAAADAARVGPMHSSITEAAFDALPEWERAIFSAQRARLIEFDCMIPDYARAASNRATLGKSAPGKNHAVIADTLLFKAKSPPAPDIPRVR